MYSPNKLTGANAGGISFSVTVLWCSLLVCVYLLSTGPVTRWFPGFANTIYAPLGPIARSKECGRPLRAWLRLWKVNVPEK